MITASRTIYPWDKWFSKASFTLKKGQDFHCSQSSMIQQVRNAAHRRNYPIRIVEGEDSFTVIRKSLKNGLPYA